MIVTSSGRVIAGNRIIINDVVNEFLGTTNSLWGTATNWSLGIIPTANQIAIIKSNCTLNVTSTVREIRIGENISLTHSSSTSLTFTNIENKGTINCNVSGASLISNTNDTLNPIWGNIDFGTFGTMVFINDTGTSISVPVLDYFNLQSGLTVTRFGTRTTTGPLIIRGNLITSKGFLLVNHDITINGNLNYGGESNGVQFSGCTVIINGSATTPNRDSIRFTNCVIYANGPFQFGGCSDSAFFFGSNTMYLKQGLSVSCGTNYAGSIQAQGTDFILTTNNQTFQTHGITVKSFTIEGDITVTLSSSGHLNTPILTGTTSNSKFVNSGTLIYTGATEMMPIGTIDCIANVNTVQYARNGDQLIKTLNYVNLFLSGTSGIKSITGNIYVDGFFRSTLSGTVTQSSASNTFIVKGDFTISSAGTTFNFPPNSEIELRGGYGGLASQSGFNTTNPLTIRYTTNNQTINLGMNNWRNNATNEFNHLIDGVEVTVNSTTYNSSYFIFTKGWINGTNSSSKLINRAFIFYSNQQTPMLIGTIDFSSFQNTFVYNSSGNQNVKEGVYSNLTLNTGGVKTLQGNVSVQSIYTLTSPATLNTNGFTLTNP